MEELCEKIVGLLGKSYNEELLLELADGLGEQPHTLRFGKFSTSYSFRNSGFQIDKHNGQFASIFFHFGSAMAESGWFQKYGENLPCDVQFGDERSVVERKMGLAPFTSQYICRNDRSEPYDLWESYKLGELEATFIFRSPALTLDSASINYPGAYSRNWAPANVSSPAPAHYLDSFSSIALAVLENAGAESRRTRRDYAGNEQLIMGILLAGANKAADALIEHGVTTEKARREIAKILSPGVSQVSMQTPFTPRSERTLGLSKKEADKLQHDTVEPEHILLAIVKEGERVPAAMLANLGVDLKLLELDLLARMTHDKRK